MISLPPGRTVNPFIATVGDWKGTKVPADASELPVTNAIVKTGMQPSQPAGVSDVADSVATFKLT